MLRKLLALLAAWFAVLCLWVAPATAETEVDYNPEGSPIPLAKMEYIVGYSVWAWTSRLPIDAQYTGTTDEQIVNGRIIVRWEDFPLTDPAGARTIRSVRRSDQSFVHTQIILNRLRVGTQTDACIAKVIVHEFGHAFGISGHSNDPMDVMSASLGECRYSPSLSDLATLNMPLTSCHVELTPHGSLEYPDHNGMRVALAPAGPDTWTWDMGRTHPNPVAMPCNGVIVQDGEVWAEVMSFQSEPTVIRLIQEGALFRSVPIQ